MIHNIDRRPKLISQTNIAFISNCFQGLAALVAILIAVWAAFFTSIPERLEQQLRTEVIAAQEELTDVRRAKRVLEDQQATLKSENDAYRSHARDLTDTALRLSAEIRGAQEFSGILSKKIEELSRRESGLSASVKTLIDQKDALNSEVEQLKAQRAQYADVALANVWAKLVAMSVYELEMYQHVAFICTNYQKHLDWVSKRKRGVRFIAAPDMWLQFPQEPNLEPNNRQALLSELDVNFIQNDNYRQFDRYATRWLFDNIVTTHGAIPLTGNNFIEHVKLYPFYDELLPEEKAKLFLELDGFLSSHEELRSEQFNVTFETEPASTAIINLGQARLQKAAKFKNAFIDFLKARGLKVDTTGFEQ